MKKRLLTVALLLSVLASLCAGTTFAADAAAAPTNDSLICDGVPQTPTVYKINGSNYFKIRDLAAILNGSGKQFNVGYDGTTKSVTAIPGEGYTKLSTDLVGAPSGGNKRALSSNDAIYINGARIDAEVYKIDGSNYFKLRDLGQALDFYVGWDDSTKTVALDTTKGYGDSASTVQTISDQELMKLATEAANAMDDMFFLLAAGGLVQKDLNDSISAVEVVGDGFGDVRAHRVVGCTTIAEGEAQLREIWYQSFSRKYSTLDTDFMSEMWMERNGKLYIIENYGMGDRGGFAVIDRMLSRTAEEAVFRGHWAYGEDDGDISEPFEISLVYEDSTWKYGYMKDSYELENS